MEIKFVVFFLARLNTTICCTWVGIYSSKCMDRDSWMCKGTGKGMLKAMCMGTSSSRCMDRASMNMGSNLSMSIMGNYNLLVSSLIRHSMMPFYFFLVLITRVRLRFELFLIFSLISLIFVILLLIFYLIILCLIIALDLVLEYCLAISFRRIFAFIVFFFSVVLFTLPIDRQALVFFFIFIILPI